MITSRARVLVERGRILAGRIAGLKREMGGEGAEIIECRGVGLDSPSFLPPGQRKVKEMVVPSLTAASAQTVPP